MLIKPRSTGRQVEQELRPQVDEMRALIAKLRHPLAHTGKGGVAEGIDDARLWEPGLLIGFDEDVAPYYFENVAGFQHKWHEATFNTTAIGLGASEAMFAKLNELLRSQSQSSTDETTVA